MNAYFAEYPPQLLTTGERCEFLGACYNIDSNPPDQMMSQNDNGKLVAHLREIVPAILDNTSVTLAYLFGSRAAGNPSPASDTDIALVLCRAEGQPRLPADERLALEFAVEAALENHKIQKPDVRVIDDLPLSFRGQVATQGVRLFSRNEEDRVAFETRTWKEYLDFEPVARRLRREFFESVRNQGLFPTK